MKSATSALASLAEMSHQKTPVSELVSKKLKIYILSVPARCWRDGVSRLASEVTATAHALGGVVRCQNASTERSFSDDSRVPAVATVAPCCVAAS